MTARVPFVGLSTDPQAPVLSAVALNAAFDTTAPLENPEFPFNVTIDGNLNVIGTISGAGGSFLPLIGGTLTTGGSTLTFTPGATTAIAPIIASSGTAGMQLNGGGVGVAIVGGGPLTTTNGITINKGIAPSGSTLSPLINWTIGLSGSTITTTPPSPFSLQTSGDTLAVAAMTSDVVRLMSVQYNFGGAGLTGNRTGLFVKTTSSAKSGNLAAGNAQGPFFQAVAFNHQQNFSEGGTDTSQGGSYGQVFAGGSTLRLLNTATGFHEATNWEADMNLAAPVYKKLGIKVTQLPSDVAQGVLDGAFVIENGGTSANNGWHNGFLAIEPNATFPYATDGWVLNAPSATDWQTFNTMAGGIRLLELTFTTGPILSRNFLVDGAGTVSVGNGYLAKTAGGVSLDASGSVGPAEGTTLSGAAIVSGGTSGFNPGHIMYDRYRGVWQISDAPVGIVTQLTCLRTPYYPSATPPTNPITLTGAPIDAGNSVGTVTVNLTWTQPNAVAISPTGGPTTIGGSLAVTGTLTGPTTTLAVDTSTTALASTAFVLGQASAVLPLIDGTATIGTSTRFARADHIHPTDTTRAPLASPTFTGTVTIPGGASISGFAPLASPTFTGTVTIPGGASISGFAPLASPTFTGTVNAAAVTASGVTSAQGGVNVGTNGTTQALNVNGPAASTRSINFNTANSLRWTLGGNATAEGGANAGTDFNIVARDDSGVVLSTPITITRSNGLLLYTGAALRFGGSNVVANGAIATTMTSLGPTGSHTTIQEWLAVQNSGGTTRYIPLY